MTRKPAASKNAAAEASTETDGELMERPEVTDYHVVDVEKPVALQAPRQGSKEQIEYFPNGIPEADDHPEDDIGDKELEDLLSALGTDLTSKESTIQGKIDALHFKADQLTKTLNIVRALNLIRSGQLDPASFLPGAGHGSAAPKAPKAPKTASSGSERAPRGAAWEEIRAIIEAAGPNTGMTRKDIMAKLSVTSGTPAYSRYANALNAAETKKGLVVKMPSGNYVLKD